MAMQNPWLGWHFLQKSRRLRFPPHTVVEAGQTLRENSRLALCMNGLHASWRALDALQYAPGPIVCRVQLAGEILVGNDKACASERTCLWWADATRTLHEFACWCAEEVLHAERAAGREPHAAHWQAIEAKRRWLRLEATDQELTAARAAALEAGRVIAWAAGRESALRAAREVSSRAAWAAASWKTAREAQNKRLEEMLHALAP